jgi:uncharacterized membrane protein
VPFCTHCGNQVQPADTFCASCGSAQDTPSPPPKSTGGSASSRDPFDGLDPRRAAVFCYIPLVGWIASIVVLAAERFRDARETRFHAFQGLYLFVAWLFVDWVFSPFTQWAQPMKAVSSILKVGVFGAWIFMLVKTSQGENYRLPLLGELADRSVSEQK